MKHLLPYNSRISFEVTHADDTTRHSCGLVSAQGIVAYWPVAIASDHGAHLGGTQYSAVQVLIHRDMDLEDVLRDLDILRDLIEDRLGDLKQVPHTKSQTHDPFWRDNLAAREHFAQTGEEPTPRQINIDE